MEALYSPDAIQAGTTLLGVPRPGPTRDARLRGLVTALETRVPRRGRPFAPGRRAEPHPRSPEILEKPGKLANCEFEEIQRHAVFGARLVASLDDPKLTAIVRHHHERLDGSGYPDRLRGEQIPIGARIVAIADTFDALTSCRPYREARTPATRSRSSRKSRA